jgi:L-malate glycosyltransferase
MEKRKHVLFISSWYPNRYNPIHGIFNKQFAEAANIKNKVSVLHVCSSEHLKTDFEIEEKIIENIFTLIIYYKKINNRIPILSQLLKRHQLLKAFELGYQQLICQTSKPNLIQLNVVMPAGIGVLFLSKKYSIPYVINEGWSGYTAQDGNYKGFVLKCITKKIIASANAILPVSEDLKMAMLHHGLNGNYFIVPNLVDVKLFAPEKKSKSDTFKFIHISALDDIQKNISGIIKAFKESLKINSNIELNIVGNGADKSKHESLVVKLGLENHIFFKGNLLGIDLVAEINNNDALIMFSNYETFCLALVECMACGKPVITSRAGGVTNLITTELGITTACKNEIQLKNAILFMANNASNYNTDIIRKFVEEKFSKHSVAAKLDEVYNKILV